jgi:hypothetical protein
MHTSVYVAHAPIRSIVYVTMVHVAGHGRELAAAMSSKQRVWSEVVMSL